MASKTGKVNSGFQHSKRILAQRFGSPEYLPDGVMSAGSATFRQYFLPNLVAGLTTGLVTLVYTVSFAALIFSGKLAPYFPQGLGCALIGATITATVVAWRSPFPFTLAGPEANSAIVLALAGRAIASALTSPDQENALYPTVWAAIILSTLASGAFLYSLGRFRLGQFARYVPYPVIAGFLAGTGWLITRSSFKVMTGVPLDFAELPRLLSTDAASQWIAGLGVAVLLFVFLHRFKHFLVLPGLLLGGIILANLARWILKVPAIGLDINEWFFEEFSQKGVWQAWNLTTFAHIDWHVLAHQTGTLLAMVGIVMVSILLNSTGLELATGRDVDLNDELRADGLANVINGACGGLVGYLSINRCLLNQRAGANSPLAGIIAGLFCGTALFSGSSFFSRIPKPLLGGLLLQMGTSLLFRWVYRSALQLPRFDYLLVLIILVIMVSAGFIAGVGSGILIACVLFIISYGQTSSIKYELSGKTYRSNVYRSVPQQEILQREADAVVIMVLHGFIFFGTANDLLERIRRRLANTAKLFCAIFDFRLVTGLDSSAVLSFIKLAQLAEKNGLNLIFTDLRPAVDAQLKRGGLAGHSHFRSFDDLDHGVEWCEDQLLETNQMLEVPPIPLLSQLETLLENKPLAADLQPYLQQVELAKGHYLFRQGEPSDGLYFLEEGGVSVVAELGNGALLRRRTYTGGTILGEMGFFSKAPRSASVIADEPSRLHYLSKEAFEKIEREAPLLASSFNRGIINLVADRLRRSEEEVKMLLQ
jgi:SulP family sulfate permease